MEELSTNQFAAVLHGNAVTSHGVVEIGARELCCGDYAESSSLAATSSLLGLVSRAMEASDR
jgi:hypothetical protein